MFGIGPQYYLHIYIWLVTLLTIMSLSQYSSYSQSRISSSSGGSSAGVFFLMVFLSVFIGLRPISSFYFVDMAGYNASYNIALGETFVFDWSTDNVIFDNYFFFLASKYVPVTFFFLSIAFVYFACMAWACIRLFPRDSFVAFLVCLGAFSSFSYATNGIKAGAAASIFLVSIALYKNRKLIWAVIFAFISLGFHHSMIVPMAALFVCHFVNNSKLYFAFWAFCFLMALFHVSFFQQLFASFADDQGAAYLTGQGETVRKDILGGFRIDFILYSAAPLVLGWVGIIKKRIISREYSFLLNLYLLTNSIWLLCMYAEFTNRIAYLSWFMLPVVLVYPLLNEEWGTSQYQTFRWVALGHLGFTLFMQYIFY